MPSFSNYRGSTLRLRRCRGTPSQLKLAASAADVCTVSGADIEPPEL
jgi:hypothetical protein